MKRIAHAWNVALAGSLLCGLGSAQTAFNDLRLHNEADVFFLYSFDTTPGKFAGESQLVPPFTTNIYVWKTWSRDTLRHCNGTMEISAVEISQYDTDWGAIDANGNNTASPDWYWTVQDPSGPQGGPPYSPVGTILPSTTAGMYLEALTASPPTLNNDFLPDPGCPAGPDEIRGYHIQYDMTEGLGAGHGITIPADGMKDFIWVTFIPGGQVYGVSNTCTSTNGSMQGDVSVVDFHSSGAIVPLAGETGFDWLGTGLSAFDGYDNGASATPPTAESFDEIGSNVIEFTEPTLAMVVDSNTGHIDPGPANGLVMAVPGPAETMLEEGLAGIHYRHSGVAGGRLSARLYAWQGLGRPCSIFGSFAPPLTFCLNFKGSKLGLLPTDPLFKFLTPIWTGTLTLTDNQYVPQTDPLKLDWNDATFRAPPLPLPATLTIPPGTFARMYFQGFYKKPLSPLVEGSQITTWYLHRP